MPQWQVLVVGAGPSGLAAALLLGRLGISVRIIDKNSARSDKSKALAIHAGTLECLQAAIDAELVEDLVRAGHPTRAAWFHFHDRAPISVDLSTVPSSYNFILNLEQNETERILEQRLSELSVYVERQTEFIEAAERGAEVVSTIKLASGHIEEVPSAFVIGGDGAHSSVRCVLGIPFQGAAYTGDFILGDVVLQWPWPYDSVRGFVNERGVIGSFPLRGERRYRLILIRPGAGATGEKPEMNLDEFQSILSELSGGTIIAQSATWLTRFRVHQRMVQQFQCGRIFLVGDAAHIHSPFGGQGMNTGIQDALNIACKLAAVLTKRTPESILLNYQRERRPIARQVLRLTGFVTRLVLLPENALQRFVRRSVLPLAVRSRFLQHHALAILSEVAIARKEISRYALGRRT